VDFLVEDTGIQVTYTPDRDEVPRREIEGLSKAKVKRRIVATWDYQDYVRVVDSFPCAAVMGFLVKCSLEVKAKSNNCCIVEIPDGRSHGQKGRKELRLERGSIRFPLNRRVI